MESEQTRRLIKATVISTQLNSSNALAVEDAFDYGADTYTPPYDLDALVKFPEYSNILPECIDAYKNNITGFGWEIIPTVDEDSLGDEDPLVKTAKDQAKKAQILFKYANYRQSFTSLTKKVVDNRERNGNGYMEVITDTLGRPAGFEFVRSDKVRILKPIGTIDKKIIVKTEDGEEYPVTIPVRFFRYVLNDNGKAVYFKEYGDPRPMDKNTGEYNKGNGDASALIHFSIDSIYSPYGVPRYIGKVPAIFGSRRSEELNIKFFQDGRVVPAAILIEGGQLTAESHAAISAGKGIDQGFKFLLLEAEGFSQGDSIVEGDTKNNVSLDIKPLTELIQQDGLFQDYDKNNRNKIRASFRIPPIYTGESQDYSKSTAQTARAVAEALVFEPERQAMAEPFNRILRDMGYDLIEFRFKPPKLTDKFELSKSLPPYVKAGTTTPNMLIEALGELLGRRVDLIKEPWGDKPLELTLKEMDMEMLTKQLDMQMKVAEQNAEAAKANADQAQANADKAKEQNPSGGEKVNENQGD